MYTLHEIENGCKKKKTKKKKTEEDEEEENVCNFYLFVCLLQFCFYKLHKFR